MIQCCNRTKLEQSSKKTDEPSLMTIYENELMRGTNDSLVRLDSIYTAADFIEVVQEVSESTTSDDCFEIDITSSTCEIVSYVCVIVSLVSFIILVVVVACR